MQISIRLLNKAANEEALAKRTFGPPREEEEEPTRKRPRLEATLDGHSTPLGDVHALIYPIDGPQCVLPRLSHYRDASC